MEKSPKQKNGNNNEFLIHADEEKGFKEIMSASKTDFQSKADPSQANLLAKSPLDLARTKLNTPSTVTSLYFFKRRIPWSNLEGREAISGEPDEILSNNKIQTNKYTMVNFIPKNLMEQFSKTANIYFLVIGIMQTIRAISITSGTPTIFLPLATILTITALKDLFEDLKRHRSDMEENKHKTRVLRNGEFVDCEWQDLRVGDIAKVIQNEYFPCDIFVLSTSEQKSIR